MATFNQRNMDYLKSLQSVLISSAYEVDHIDYKNETFCINKVDYWKKRNGKIVKVWHHFRKWYKLPKEMIKYQQVQKKGYSTSWVWSDDPEYTYTQNQKYITRGDARKLVTMQKDLEPIN